jgi:hypothetical protein
VVVVAVLWGLRGRCPIDFTPPNNATAALMSPLLIGGGGSSPRPIGGRFARSASRKALRGIGIMTSVS